MIPQTKSEKSVETNGVTKNVSFGIKASGIHHVLGILRDQLYSDKEGAVIREYACNAYDAHVEAGCVDRPIEVFLPTRLKPELKVRDFGSALSDHEIQDVYAFYGESTKRSSNEMTGMLGIGSKSAFAYGDNFVINSYIDGTKHIYNAYIDPSQVGQISKLGEEQSDEENGIEIVVPVKDEDIEVFQAKAKTLLAFFKVKPLVHNASFEFDNYDVLVQGDGWRWENRNDNRYYSGSATIVMGNIGYPLAARKLNFSDEEITEGLDDVVNENLIIDMNIGDVEVSASRENLQYTEFTINNIKNKLRKIKSEMADEITKQFEEADTLFGAKQLYGSIFDTTSHLYVFRNMLKGKLTWKGKIVEGDNIDCHSDMREPLKGHRIELHKFTKGYRAMRYRPEECGHISCSKDTVVIENDLGHRRGVMGRILDLILNQNKKVFLISFQDEGAAALFNGDGKARKTLADRGLDHKMIKLSELPKRPLSDFGYGGTRSSGGKGSKKHTTKEFVLNIETLSHTGYGDTKSNVWDSIDLDLDNDSGVYVELDRFFIVNESCYGRYGGQNTPAVVNRLLNKAEALGLEVPKIYGFKKNSKSLDKAKSNPKWISLWDHLKSEVYAKCQKLNAIQSYVDREEIVAIQNQYDWVRKFNFSNSEFTDSLVDGKMKEFAAKITEMCAGDFKTAEDLKDFAENIGSELNFSEKPTHDLSEIAQDCHERYSMITLIDLSWRFEFDKIKDKISQYINLVDVCGNLND